MSQVWKSWDWLEKQKISFLILHLFRNSTHSLCSVPVLRNVKVWAFKEIYLFQPEGIRTFFFFSLVILVQLHDTKLRALRWGKKAPSNFQGAPCQTNEWNGWSLACKCTPDLCSHQVCVATLQSSPPMLHGYMSREHPPRTCENQLKISEVIPLSIANFCWGSADRSIWTWAPNQGTQQFQRVGGKTLLTALMEISWLRGPTMKCIGSCKK